MKKRVNKKENIQTEILMRLAKGNDLRFSNIQIKEIDSNLFTYHLGKLKESGLVLKNGLKYNLSEEGKKYIDRLSAKNFKIRPQPKIANMILCKNTAGEYLIYKRKKHPFLGKFGFMYGKIHFGETLLESAKRELKEKTGWEMTPVHKGDVYVLVKNKKEIVTHTLFHVFLIDKISNNVEMENIYGTFIWGNIEDIKNEEKIPGAQEIKDLVEKNKNFIFKELEINI